MTNEISDGGAVEFRVSVVSTYPYASTILVTGLKRSQCELYKTDHPYTITNTNAIILDALVAHMNMLLKPTFCQSTETKILHISSLTSLLVSCCSKRVKFSTHFPTMRLSRSNT
jgi:hypothetical protein